MNEVNGNTMLVIEVRKSVMTFSKIVFTAGKLKAGLLKCSPNFIREIFGICISQSNLGASFGKMF